MKKIQILLLSVCPAVFGQSTIDLSKPVSQSLKPDVVYWSFDQGLPGQSLPEVVEDESGNGLDGRLLAGAVQPEPTYVEGKFGAGIRFPGATPAVVGEDGFSRQVQLNPRVMWRLKKVTGSPDGASLDMAGKSFTGGAWVKIEKIKEGEPQSISLMHQGAAEGQWSFNLMKDERDSWKLSAVFTPSSEKTEVLNNRAWHHVAFAFETKNGESQITFWLDGEPLGDPVPTTRVIAQAPTEKHRAFTVGERNMGYFSTGFEGAVDDVFVTSGVQGFKP